MLAQLEKLEIEILSKKLKDNWKFLYKVAGMGVLITPILFLTTQDFPKKLLIRSTSRRAFNQEAMNEAFFALIILMVIIWLILFFTSIPSLRRDLKSQKKVIGKVEVLRIEKINPKIAKDLEDGKNTILHFEQNTHRIKKFYFNRDKYPEYMNAKQIIIERAKYSKIVFNSEVVTT